MSARDPVRAIADAVLYEGYVLWPYRRSALKNAQRWTFGGVYPRAHAEARAAGDDPWTMQTQCLVEGPDDAQVAVTVRFLHVVHRQALDPDGRPLDALDAGDERHLTWDEAAEREVVMPALSLAELAAGDPRRVPIAVPAGAAREPVGGHGALERSWEQLEGLVTVWADPLAPDLHRVTVAIENATAWPPGAGPVPGMPAGAGADPDRERALRRTFCSTHTILRADGGAFVSLTDPPERLRAAAASCENEGTWPVLAGEPPARDTLLSSPIILSDHPQVAPESPGDLFDGGEIDQLLILNILALTDEEKAEMRATDARARELLERTEQLSPEQLLALHGRTVRDAQVRR